MEEFRNLEEACGLDINNENHVWLLQVLFLPMLNADLAAFCSGWNNHVLRRAGDRHRSPAELFFMGMFENGIRGYQLPPQEIPAPPTPVHQPQQLTGVEVTAPEPTDERLFILQRISSRFDANAIGRERMPRAVSEIWNDSLIECRTMFPRSF